MGTEKGLFQDDDRFSPAHQEMASWFAQNARPFVRRFLCDMPVTLDINLEVPVTSANGFLYGFADVLLGYRTDQAAEHRVLVELKSRFRDFGKILRQLNTYKTYLPNITKVCFIHDDDWWDETTIGFADAALEDYDDAKWGKCWEKTDRVFEMRRYFGSQDIYVTPFSLLRAGFFGYNEVPSGRRMATLREVSQATEHSHWGIHFDVELPEQGSVGACQGVFTDPPQDEFWRILKAARNLTTDGDGRPSLAGKLDVPCLIDVSHVPDVECRVSEVVEAMHSRDLSVSLKFDILAGVRSNLMHNLPWT